MKTKLTIIILAIILAVSFTACEEEIITPEGPPTEEAIVDSLDRLYLITFDETRFMFNEHYQPIAFFDDNEWHESPDHYIHRIEYIVCTKQEAWTIVFNNSNNYPFALDSTLCDGETIQYELHCTAIIFEE